MEETFYKRLGKKIKNLRKQSKLSQEKLAEKIGISAYYYGEIERGTKKAKIDKLLQIAKIFEIKIHELVNLDNE